MAIALAATWNPRGELPRFANLLPSLEEVYQHLAISFPPVADPQVVKVFQEGQYACRSTISVVVNQDWNWGRYTALQAALASTAAHIHYADMDRLLRWVETRPEEWRRTIQHMQSCDCLIVGRTRAAYSTHPQALVQTEALSNQVVSFLVGQEMDVSAGSKGFSRRAAEFLVNHTLPQRALGTDGEWTVLLKRAGFSVDYLRVDGLDWESADRYQDKAADVQNQRLVAEAYDADPAHWARRVEIAMEIVQSAIDAAQRVILVVPRLPGEDGSNRDE